MIGRGAKTRALQTGADGRAEQTAVKQTIHPKSRINQKTSIGNIRLHELCFIDLLDMEHAEKVFIEQNHVIQSVHLRISLQKPFSAAAFIYLSWTEAGGGEEEKLGQGVRIGWVN